MHPRAENPTAAHALQGSLAPPPAASGQASAGLPTRDSASRSAEEVLAALASSGDGLNAAQARRRLAATGPNAVRTHHFHAGPALFRSGWFVESLATQTMVIFVIRTRRTPFLRSRPSLPLAAAALVVVAIGVALPLTPLAGRLGFQALPVPFYLALAAVVVVYLTLVDAGKQVFFAREAQREPAPRERRSDRRHRLERRASRFTHAGPLRPPGARAPS
jgi:magnesium-transporting ATPase (P-type)